PGLDPLSLLSELLGLLMHRMPPDRDNESREKWSRIERALHACNLQLEHDGNVSAADSVTTRVHTMNCEPSHAAKSGYYHVYILLKDPQNDSVTKLGLSESELQERVIYPYDHCLPFVLNGRTIEPDNILSIQISR